MGPGQAERFTDPQAFSHLSLLTSHFWGAPASGGAGKGNWYTERWRTGVWDRGATRVVPLCTGPGRAIMVSTGAATTRSQDADAGLTPDALRQMYREMLLARLFDERMLQLHKIGKVALAISAQGHEGAQIGAAFTFDTTQDWFLPYYRDFAVCLHAGMTIQDLMLNLLAKAGDPNSGGRQMPAHFGSRRLRIVTGSSPVATQCLHACGVAYAIKLRRESAVVYVALGEGSTSEGDFHEALNFAAIHRLPIIFYVQNNGYAISVPTERQMAVADVADRAAAYGMPGAVVDGSDVIATYEGVREWWSAPGAARGRR